MPPKKVKPMDKLAKQLRDDAEQINVSVSDELDHRIAASLRAVTPVEESKRTPVVRPPLFWWASTITGVAAALAVIAIGPTTARSPLMPIGRWMSRGFSAMAAKTSSHSPSTLVPYPWSWVLSPASAKTFSQAATNRERDRSPPDR